jgi:photosystem II stability/assembly factor-like uncharacterized protein
MKRFIYLVIFVAILGSCNIFSQTGTWKRILDMETFEIHANPHNFNTLYAGGNSRIVMRSYDAGKTWDSLLVQYTVGTTTARFNNLIVHPIDTSVILVGGILIGEVFRSSDNGNTWESVLNRTSGITLNGKAMVIDEKNPDILYLGDFSSGDIFRSHNRGLTWDSISSVEKLVQYKDDLGNIRDTLAEVNIGSMGIRPDSTNILFANSITGEIFMSRDSGSTWTFIQQLHRPIGDTTDCEITRMTFGPRDPLTGYCVITYLFKGNTPNGGCFKTTDGGYSWNQMAFADTSLWAVDARDYNGKDEVFVGGYTEDSYVLEEYKVPGNGIVRRSQDGGKTWFSYDNKIDWWKSDYRSDSDFNCVSWLNGKNAFACGDNGLNYRTNDSGRVWRIMSYELTDDIYDVQLISNSKVYIVGKSGLIKVSYAGGTKYIDVNYKTTKDLNTVHFIDTLQGSIAGDGGLLIITKDGGNIWTEINTGFDNDFKSIQFVDANVGFLAGSNGLIAKSVDLGLNWTKLNTGTNENLYKVFAVNSSLIYACGDAGTLISSSDGGINWKKLDLGTNIDLSSIHFMNPDSGYVCGDRGRIFHTIDAGNSWQVKFADTTKRYNDIDFSPEGTGTVVGNGRMMYMYPDSSYNWYVKIYGWSGAISNVWSQRYWGPKGQEKIYMATEAGLFVLDDPADVNEQVRIEEPALLLSLDADGAIILTYFRVSDKSEPINIQLVDLTGRIVQERNIPISSNLMRERIDRKSLTRGLYILQLIDNGKILTRKIILP